MERITGNKNREQENVNKVAEIKFKRVFKKHIRINENRNVNRYHNHVIAEILFFRS